MPKIQPLDSIIRTAVPMELVPLAEEFKPLLEYGFRYLCAKDGLYTEINMPWVYVRLPISRPTAIPLPYGATTQTIEFKFGQPPVLAFNQFLASAKAATPNEIAGAISWSPNTGFRYQPLPLLPAKTKAVRHYAIPALLEDEFLVFDLRSNGNSRPSLRHPDMNSRDGSFTKITCIIGNLNEQTPAALFQLHANGLAVSIDPLFNLACI